MDEENPGSTDGPPDVTSDPGIANETTMQDMMSTFSTSAPGSSGSTADPGYVKAYPRLLLGKDPNIDSIFISLTESVAVLLMGVICLFLIRLIYSYFLEPNKEGKNQDVELGPGDGKSKKSLQRDTSESKQIEDANGPSAKSTDSGSATPQAKKSAPGTQHKSKKSSLSGKNQSTNKKRTSAPQAQKSIKASPEPASGPPSSEPAAGPPAPGAEPSRLLPSKSVKKSGSKSGRSKSGGSRGGGSKRGGSKKGKSKKSLK